MSTPTEIAPPTEPRLMALVEDACGTTHADLHDVTMRNFQRLFRRVRSTAQVLDELPVATTACEEVKP